MCGIFGCYLNRELCDSDIKLAEKCLKSLSHRGPDGEGLWFEKEKGVILGHRRLSIIDISDKNHQPMKIDSNVFIYNGELYNYRELKEELKADGTTFLTTGDTEVFFKSLLRWKDKALDKFDGMFAYALYCQGKLWLGTDPFGEKPLYLFRNKDGIYFSSELNVFEEYFNAQRNLDKETIEQFLGLGFLPETKTGFKNIEKAGPASSIVIEGKKITKSRYWYPFKVNSGTDKLRSSDIDEIHHELIKSVKNRIISDVPVGIFLSGGIDSSVIAAIVKKELDVDMHAFTVKFAGGEVYDESEDAGKIANHLGIKHVILQGDIESAQNTPSDVFSLLGELSDNITVLSSYMMAKEASKYIKVALTGMGGDEMFYGYNKYVELYNFRHLFNLPAVLRKTGAMVADRFFPQKQRFGLFLAAGRENSYISVKNKTAFGYLVKMKGLQSFLKNEMAHFGKDIVAAGRMFDICHTMPNSFIPNSERGSMRASIEARTPYLNRNLFNKIQHYQPGDFLKNGRKWVLRQIAERYIPSKLFSDTKRGFIKPKDEFLNSFISKKELLDLAANYNLGRELIESTDSGSKDIRLRLALMSRFLGRQS